MKTMTCKQLGGPCDTPITAGSKDEMMTKGGDHLKEMAGKGDKAHQDALAMMMKGADSPENVAWMEKFDADYAAQPED